MIPESNETNNIGCILIPISYSSFADLDVLFISRTPRLPRYEINYTPNGPVSSTGGSWPASGSNMIYTAKVKNNGNTGTNTYSYAWYVNGNQVRSGSDNTILPGQTKLFSLSRGYSANGEEIEFRVTPNAQVNDLSNVNNIRKIRSNALSFRLHVEQTVYNTFNSMENIVGTYSFEDWAQSHMDRLNQLISDGYDNLPNGLGSGVQKERVFIDEIVIEPDNTLPRGGEHAPLNIDWDSRWGFETDEWNNAKINQWIRRHEASLLHEWTHQIGIIDEYRFNFDGNYASNNLVNGATYSLPYSGLMNADVMEFSNHTIFALKANKGYRRGYYGEYLYDIPLNNSVIAKNNSGNTICNAQIRFYQAVSDHIDTVPEILGYTNTVGNIALPNKTVVPINTSTNHVLRNNPFGQIDVVGQNGLFLVELNLNGQKYYDWLSIYRFNYEYWKGNTNNATYNLQFEIPTSLLPSCNNNLPDLVSYENQSNPTGIIFDDSQNSVVVATKNLSTSMPVNSQFKVRGVIVDEVVNNPVEFNIAYNTNTNLRSEVSVSSVGTTTNNPVYSTLNFPSTNFADHQEKKLCVFVDATTNISESNEYNNVVCQEIPHYFSCDRVTQIPRAECEALVNLYESTNGDQWTNILQFQKWMESNEPCSTWYGIGCSSIDGGNVTSIGLSYRNLTGSIPYQIQNLTYLRYLDLSYNQLQGELPQEIGSLNNLIGLNLRSNNFVGSIPNQIGNLTNLIRIDLSNNNLSGSIPIEIGNLNLLQKLNIDYNQIQGNIPSQLSSLTNMSELTISHNQLIGRLPFYNVSQHLPGLRIFFWGNNDLCVEGGAQGQTVAWLNAVENRDPDTVGVLPSPQDAGINYSCPAQLIDLIPFSGSNGYYNGVSFLGGSDNIAGIAVSNIGDVEVTNQFMVKGVIANEPLTTVNSFINAYNNNTYKGFINFESIGTTTHNPRYGSITFGGGSIFSTNQGKYICVLIDADFAVGETNESNNIGCNQIPIQTQSIDLVPYAGIIGGVNYNRGVGFNTNLNDTAKIGILNNVNLVSNLQFSVKGVVSTNDINPSDINSFNNLYNSAGTNIKRVIYVNGIGSGSINNPKFADMVMSLNWSQHPNKYFCIYINSAGEINEPNNNNIGCSQIPAVYTQNSDLRGFTGIYNSKTYTNGISLINSSTLGYAVRNNGSSSTNRSFIVRSFLTNSATNAISSRNFYQYWDLAPFSQKASITHSNNIATNTIGAGSFSMDISNHQSVCIKFDSLDNMVGNIVETDEWNNFGCILTSQLGAPDLRILTNTYNGKVYTKGLAKGSAVNQVYFAVKNIGQSATQTSFNIKVFFTNDEVNSVTSGNFFSKYNALPDAQKRNSMWQTNVPAGSIISNFQDFGTGFNYNNYQNVCIKFDAEDTLVGRIPESDEWNNFGCGRVVDLLRW